MSDYKRLDDSGLSALVTGYFTKIKDKLEDLGGLSNDAVATVEEETASKNYTPGDYFIKNDKLNVVKQNTTVDTTWIKDENYEETSISEELNSINQKIDEIPRPSGSMNITQNGTYDVTTKAEAVVNVPQPSGTKQVSISQNGTTTEDVEDYENAQITVNVQPNLTTKNITQNGTYAASGDSADGYSSVTVNVPGGADYTTEDAIITRTISGGYTNDRITTLGSHAFEGCSGLKSVSLPNLETAGESTFANCGELNSVYLPKLVSVTASMFKYDYALTSVSLPNLKSGGTSMFSDCSGLKSVSLPNLETAGSYYFIKCNKLTGIIELPKLTEISSYFGQNGYWKAIDIGSDCQTIGTQAFGNNSNYRRYNNGYVALRTNSVVTASGQIIINNPSWQPYFLVPSALVNSYKSATNWSSISSYILALENFTTDGTVTGPLDPTKLN